MTTRPPADAIVCSSRVVTLDDGAAERDLVGVAMRDGRIDALVGRGELEAHRGPDTVVYDAGDRPVLPGFVDVHAHFEVAARSAYGTVDCRAPECSNVDEVLQALSAGLADTPTDWVVGQANLFFDRKLREGRLPTREELDTVSADRPIALRAGGHITVLNSRALEVSGIDADFVPPDSSITGRPAVIHDECGCPNGVVKEMDNLLPLPRHDGDSLQHALEDTLKKLFTQHGVTAFGEISETVAGLESMDGLAVQGRFPAHVSTYLWAPGTMSLDEACDWQRHVRLTDGSTVRVHGLKLFADGGYSAKSAAVHHPYLDTDGHRGDIALTEEFMIHALEETRRAGLQLAIHANGDRAQEWLCGVIARAGGAPGGHLRTRIEHAGNFCPSHTTVESWEAAGVIPVPQAVFLYTFGDYFADYLGDYGTVGRFPFAGLLAEGWELSASSDVWVGSERSATEPMFGVWCCVRRESYAGNVIDPDQRVTVDQALRMHTINAAGVLGMADQIGSLAQGKRADLVVLSGDPYRVTTDELPHIKPDAVFFGGELVHERPAAAAWGRGV